MNDIDKRVVEFEFDNSKFERNVKQSIKTLDELKGSLDFKDTSENLDKVGVKISAIEIAAITAISRVTNGIINLGIRITKSLSIDNVYNGWSKFGEKTISVATIAAQSVKVAGKELTDYEEKMNAINEQLDKLNWFTDETSYNFTDMVNNIGLFTAAGQDLDVSVNAMMGIATWAALSGQNASKASHAMYQLSQAMGSGTIRLQDWKSIETAGMATKEFKETVLETAVAVGELTKQGNKYITKTGKKFESDNFRESLSSGWFTSSVLTKSLEKYSSAVQKVYEISEETGLTASEVMKRYSSELDEFGLKAFKAAQEARTLGDAINSVKDAVSTGWMNTAENIIGGYDESKELWTDLANELYDVFAEGGNFRNDILSTWNELGGRNDLFKHGGKDQGAFWNIYDSIIEVKEIISKSWNDIFPKTEFQGYSDKINDLSNKFKQYTERLKESTSKLKEQFSEGTRLYNILSGIFSIIKLTLNIIQAIRYSVDPLIQAIKDIADETITFMSDLGIGLTKTDKFSEKIFEIAKKINIVLSKIIEIINPRGVLRRIISIIKNITSVTKNLFNSFAEGFESTAYSGEGLYSVLDIVNDITSKLSKVISNIIGLIEKHLVPVINKIINIIGTFVGKIAGYSTHIVKYLGLALDKIVNFFKDNKGITDAMKNISNGFNSFKLSLSSFFDSLGKGIKSSGKSKGLNDSVMKLMDSSGLSEEKIKDLSLKERILNRLKKIYESILPLIEALKNVFDSIVVLLKGLIKTIAVFLNVISDIFRFIGEIDFERIIDFIKNNYKTIIAITATSLILVLALKKLYDVWYLITAAVGGFGVALDSLAGYLDKLAIKTLGDAIKSFATAIAELLLSISIFSIIIANSDPKDIWQSVGIVTILIAMLSAFGIIMAKFSNSGRATISKIIEAEKVTKTINSTSNAAVFISVSKMFKSIGMAMLEIAIAMKIFESVNPNVCNAATLVITAMMLAAIAMTKIMSKTAESTNGMAKASTNIKIGFLSILSMGFMIKKFADSVSELSNLGWKQLWPTIVLISSVLLGFIGILIVLGTIDKKGKEISKSIKSLSYLTASLVSIGLTLKILSTIGWNNILVGTAAIVSVLSVLGLVFLALEMSSKTIISGGNIIGSMDISKPILSLAALVSSMLILAESIKVLSNINPSKIWMAYGFIAAMSVILVAFDLCINAIDKLDNNKNAYKTILSLSVFTSSLLGLALCLKILDSVNLKENLGKDILLLSAIAATLAGTIGIISLAKPNNNTDKVIRSLWGIIPLLVGLVLSCSILSLLPTDKLIYGLAGVSLFMISVSSTLKSISKVGTVDKGITKMLVSMIGISIALTAFVHAFEVFSNGNPVELLGFAISLSMFMIAFGATLKIITKVGAEVKNAYSALMAMTGLVAVILSFASALDILKEVPFEIILAGTLAISAFMIALASSVLLLTKVGADPMTMLSFALSIVVLSSSLAFLAVALTTLSNVKLSKIWPQLLAFSGALAILMATSILLKSASKEILTLAGAITLIGIGMLLIAESMVIMSESLGVAIESMKQNLESFMELLSGMLTGFLEIVINSGSLIAESVSTIIISICESILNSLESITKVISEIIKSLLKVVRNTAPDFVTTATELVTTVLKGMHSSIKEWVNIMVDIIIAFFDALTPRLPELIETLTEFLTSFIESSFESLGNRLGRIISAAINLLLKFIKELGIQFKKTAMSMGAAMVEFGLNLLAGLWNGIVGGLAHLLGKIPVVGSEIEKWMKNTLEIHSPSKMTQRMGVFLMKGLEVGMEDGLKDTKNTVTDTMSEVISSIESTIEDETDDELTLTPVLDLSNVKNGARDISEIMSSINGSTVSVSERLANNVSNGMNKADSIKNQNGNVTNNNSNDIYNISFNVTTNDPEELARQTDTILQRNRSKINLAKGGA